MPLYGTGLSSMYGTLGVIPNMEGKQNLQNKNISQEYEGMEGQKDRGWVRREGGKDVWMKS